MLRGLLGKQVDQRCKEKREHQTGEFYSRGSNEGIGVHGVEIQFEEGNIRIDGELINGGSKPAWNRLKENLKKRVKN